MGAVPDRLEYFGSSVQGFIQSVLAVNADQVEDLKDLFDWHQVQEMIREEIDSQLIYNYDIQMAAIALDVSWIGRTDIQAADLMGELYDALFAYWICHAHSEVEHEEWRRSA